MEHLMPAPSAPTHDLLRLREPIALAADAPVPSWVEPVLRRIPWVVVRRGHIRDGMMPVGVRGLTRSQRFAAFVAVATSAIGSRNRIRSWALAGLPAIKRSIVLPTSSAP